MTTYPYDYADAHRHDRDEPRPIARRGRHRADEDDAELAPVIPLFERVSNGRRRHDRDQFDDGAYDEWHDEDGGLIVRYTDPDGLGAS